MVNMLRVRDPAVGICALCFAGNWGELPPTGPLVVRSWTRIMRSVQVSGTISIVADDYRTANQRTAALKHVITARFVHFSILMQESPGLCWVRSIADRPGWELLPLHELRSSGATILI
jgi:hypothetical protein